MQALQVKLLRSLADINPPNVLRDLATCVALLWKIAAVVVPSFRLHILLASITIKCNGHILHEVL